MGVRWRREDEDFFSSAFREFHNVGKAVITYCFHVKVLHGV